jgi:clan AA aspartic protease
VNGHVDEARRALIKIRVGNTASDQSESITVWVDTAFNGFLVFSRDLIDQLGLEQDAATDAILADGNFITLEAYICYVDWFGEIVAAQVIANDGRLPLLGTELLADRNLLVNYPQRIVSLA